MILQFFFNYLFSDGYVPRHYLLHEYVLFYNHYYHYYYNKLYYSLCNNSKSVLLNDAFFYFRENDIYDDIDNMTGMGVQRNGSLSQRFTAVNVIASDNFLKRCFYSV